VRAHDDQVGLRFLPVSQDLRRRLAEPDDRLHLERPRVMLAYLGTDLVVEFFEIDPVCYPRCGDYYKYSMPLLEPVEVLADVRYYLSITGASWLVDSVGVGAFAGPAWQLDSFYSGLHTGGSDARTRPTTPPERPSTFRALLGAALEKQRLRRGLTQSQLAEYADLSLKYVGEIERGGADTTLAAIERLAEALDWDRLNAFDVREPITEGVRVMLLGEGEQMRERLLSMVTSLRAIDPALHAEGRPGLATPPGKQGKALARRSRSRRFSAPPR
jgi:transcriptional regulator with XRE-family HTH domain